MAPEAAPPRRRAANADAKSRAQGTSWHAGCARRRQDPNATRKRREVRRLKNGGPRFRAKSPKEPQRQTTNRGGGAGRRRASEGSAHLGFAIPRGRAKAACHSASQRQGVRSSPERRNDTGRRRVSEGVCGARDSPAARPSVLRYAPSHAQGARSGATGVRSVKGSAVRQNGGTERCQSASQRQSVPPFVKTAEPKKRRNQKPPTGRSGALSALRASKGRRLDSPHGSAARCVAKRPRTVEVSTGESPVRILKRALLGGSHLQLHLAPRLVGAQGGLGRLLGRQRGKLLLDGGLLLAHGRDVDVA